MRGEYVGPDEREFKYRLWRVNINGQVVEGRWRSARNAIAAAASMLLGNQRDVEPELDYTELVAHVECIGEPKERLPLQVRPEVRCDYCDAGEPSVWDNELEWFAHPDGDKLRCCANPWRQRQP